jgi:hypothetical protein
VRRSTGTAIFFAYSDPSAGEYGGVYQAAGWAYLGQGLNGKSGERRQRLCVRPPGGTWRSDRELRRSGRRLSFAEARKAGWQIESRPAKYVYAVNVGRERQAWCLGLAVLPYPAPRPRLKRLRNSGSSKPSGSPR